MSDLIDRVKLLDDIAALRSASRSAYPRRSFCVSDVIWAIRQAPSLEQQAVDAVEVTRCVDCRNHGQADFDTPEDYVWCKKHRAYMTADNYCKNGEAK